MASPQIRFDSSTLTISRKLARLSAMAMLVFGASFAATAADDSSSKNTRYQAERAACDSGLSTQNRETCLREAGAALDASKEGRLSTDPSAQHQNASLRCNALPGDDRDACQRRVNGEGTTTGSVGSGGVIRELVTPVTQ